MGHLNIANNNLGFNVPSLESMQGLLECRSIHTLYINNNPLDDPAIVDEVLVKLPELGVLYCQHNSFLQQIPSLRKHMIVKIKSLEYFNDRPVFADERRTAEAWFTGAAE